MWPSLGCQRTIVPAAPWQSTCGRHEKRRVIQAQPAVMPRKGREGMVRTAIVSCRIASSSATWASLLLPLPAAHDPHTIS